ncbi:MAG TPA: ComEC/Rec2 family competence protein [Rhizomicrobium sp.]|nr:ComEC/Rec2 family competence protein [Rhizomicrobium sp.]
MAIALDLKGRQAASRLASLLARALSTAANAFLAERDRWALWLPAGVAFGIGIYFALPFEPSLAVASGLGGAGVLLGLAAIVSPELGVKAFLAALAAFLIGFAAAKLREETIAAPVIVHRLGPVEMAGRVEFAQAHGEAVRAVIAPDFLAHHYDLALPAHVRVTFRKDRGALVPGSEIAFKAVLLPPPAPAAPGDYDFGRAAFFEGLGAVGYAYGEPQLIAPAPSPPDLSARIGGAIQYLRWQMSQRIHSVLAGSTGAIASAIITGDRGGISDEDDMALRDAGLAHVLAIAGLHMALVGMGLFWTVRAVLAAIPRIALVYPIKKWAAIAALFGAGFYLVISGAAAATTRAFVMLAMMLIAILFDRPAISMRSLAIAACVLLLARPESLTEPGFQMSFAAVAALIAVAEWEQSHRRPHAAEPVRFAAARRYLRGIAITSFVGSLATMPYAAFHFDRATHYAVLGNLGAMPVMGFVAMPAAAVSVIAMPFGLDKWPLRVMGFGIDTMLAVGRFVSHLPGAVQIVSAWPMMALVLVSLGGLWIVIWRAHFRWLGFAPILAGLLVAFFVRPPDLLVARDGATVALRGKDGLLHLLGPSADSYSTIEWLKRDGDGRAPAAAIAAQARGARCDDWGCIGYSADGESIALVLHPDALAEDCMHADILVSTTPVRQPCVGPRLVIDRFDVARNGAYAVWLGKTLRMETVAEDRGRRPWSVKPKRAYGAADD